MIKDNEMKALRKIGCDMKVEKDHYDEAKYLESKILKNLRVLQSDFIDSIGNNFFEFIKGNKSEITEMIDHCALGFYYEDLPQEIKEYCLIAGLNFYDMDEYGSSHSDEYTITGFGQVRIIIYEEGEIEIIFLDFKSDLDGLNKLTSALKTEIYEGLDNITLGQDILNKIEGIKSFIDKGE